MSKDIVVSVKNVKKDFFLPHEKSSKSIKSLIVNIGKKKNKELTTQHALKDISFDIKKGEFFGIVGRNGSGKSTLLKILAGIYQPTAGSARTYGRLVPFIELGVGFNPELSGRENVFLNGALLGFTRKEIEAIYDDIVEFAELERFMDQKLKNYSSGMQVRLAFSVAIKAQGDILVLDEVLAVGDEAFQRKCDEYFKSIKEDPTKTVVLVTHSMDAVRKFCDRAMMIRDGKVVIDGAPGDVANEYTQENYDTGKDKNENDRLGLSALVPDFKVTPVSKPVLSAGEDMVFEIEYEITSDQPVHVAFSIVDDTRDCAVMSNRTEAISGKGVHKLKYVFPTDLYSDTDFSVSAVMDEMDTYKRIAFTDTGNSCKFMVRNEFVFSSLLLPVGEHHGYWEGAEEFLVDKSGRRMK